MISRDVRRGSWLAFEAGSTCSLQPIGEPQLGDIRHRLTLISKTHKFQALGKRRSIEITRTSFENLGILLPMKKNQKKRRYSGIVIAIGVSSVVGPASYLLLSLAGNQGAGAIVLWITALPSIIFVSVSLVVLGAAAPYRPLVSRESLLWSWLHFLGRGSAGVLLLVSGSLIGALLGILAADPGDDFSGLIFFGAAVVYVWLTMIAIMWTIRASVDVKRLGAQRERLIEEWLVEQKTRKPKPKAVLLASGSELASVVIVGLVMVFLLTTALFGIATLSGFWSSS